MMITSTSKILGKLVTKADKAQTVSHSQENEYPQAHDAPQLTPAPQQKEELQDALLQALGYSSSKTHSPMDK